MNQFRSPEGEPAPKQPALEGDIPQPELWKLGPDGKYYITPEGLEAAIKDYEKKFHRINFKSKIINKEKNPYGNIISPDEFREAASRLVRLNPHQLKTLEKLLPIVNERLPNPKEENPPSAVVPDTPNPTK